MGASLRALSVIRRSSIAELELAPNLAELLAEYAAETAIAELGTASPDVETYRRLAAAGVIHPIGAFDGDTLAGFVLPVVGVLPHYAGLNAQIESFFVSRRYRSSSVGARLLVEAEHLAARLGAQGVTLSAPVGGILDRTLERRPVYRHAGNHYVRSLT
jgi:GNAT superfamily N-acetyltransferase